jgi:hypothetical protein
VGIVQAWFAKGRWTVGCACESVPVGQYFGSCLSVQKVLERFGQHVEGFALSPARPERQRNVVPHGSTTRTSAQEGRDEQVVNAWREYRDESPLISYPTG